MARDASPEIAALERALLAMDRVTAVRILTGGPLASGMAATPGVDGAALPAVPLERIDTVLVPVLRSIGLQWGAGHAALSQVYMAARIAEEIVERVEPAQRAVRPGAPRVGVAVLEDRHELGKRIVAMSLRAVGYPPIDYGAGIGADDLARRAADDDLDVLLVSTLMLRSVMRVEALAGHFARMRKAPRLVVGGAPFLFDESLWREVGADAMGRTASDAIAFAEAAIAVAPAVATQPGSADLSVRGMPS